MDIINKNIRTLRKLENIKSQSFFGELIGVPSHNINKYENNVIPKPEVLRKIATEFNINLHLFLTKEMHDTNYAEFKIENNTAAKLENIINQSSKDFEITRSDLDQVTAFFEDKLKLIEEGEINDIDKKRLFGDIRSILIAFKTKLEEFYIMQDHLSQIIIGEKGPNQP